MPNKINKKRKYALVDENGKVLEEFYHWNTAHQNKGYYKKRYGAISVRIVKLRVELVRR